jgi:hypothetical protein
VRLIFDVFQLGPTIETEADMFEYIFREHSSPWASPAFVNCLRSLPETRRKEGRTSVLRSQTSCSAAPIRAYELPTAPFRGL